ncbi:MAG: trigger factor [Acidobacteriota bacterium]
MTYRTEQLSPCRIAVNAAVAADRVGSEREKIVANWMRAVRIDGFRKGKAPRALVERRYGKEIDEDLVEGLVRTAWDEVREGEKLRPAGPLDVRGTDWKEDGSFEVSAELDVYPRVELPGLDGFSLPAVDIEPGEGEIEDAVTQLRERQAVWEPADSEPVAEGLLVEAEVWGSFPAGGGEPFHEERSLFQLGRAEVYPEIEGAVTGHLVGDEVSAERVLGEEAPEERRGTRVAYRVKIKSLRRKRLPEVDDAFAASLGVPEGLAKLRERVAERIRLDKTRRRHDAWREALVRHLGGDTELAMPETLVEEETRKELVELATAFAERGIDPRSGVEWDKIRPEVRERVVRKLRSELLLDALAEARGIVVSDGEVDAEVERQAKGMGVPFGELRGNLAKRGGLERIRALLQRERAVDQVLTEARKEG